MKLVVDRDAVAEVMPLIKELGLLPVSKNYTKGTLQLDPRQLGDTKLRWLTRLFLLSIGRPGVHVEVYRGDGYVCYCFLKESV